MEIEKSSKTPTKLPVAYASFDRFLGGITDKSKIVLMLDGIIREDLERPGHDYARLIKYSDAVKIFSRQFKSRVIFAILRSFSAEQASPSYKSFIKDFCDGDNDFCSEGNYARHRAAQEFIRQCSNKEAVKYLESLPEGKIRRYIKKSRGVENKSQLLLEFYDSVTKKKPDEKATDALFNSALKKQTVLPESKITSRIISHKHTEKSKKNLERLLNDLEKKIPPESESALLYSETKKALKVGFDKLQKLLESLAHEEQI